MEQVKETDFVTAARSLQSKSRKGGACIQRYDRLLSRATVACRGDTVCGAFPAEPWYGIGLGGRMVNFRDALQGRFPGNGV
jgi:hypothetical protein